MSQNWITEYKKNLFFRMDENTRMINISLSHLSEDELWKKPNAQSNSIGNLLLHLCGNITQYAISGLGHQKDVRNRDAEFKTEGIATKTELLFQLEQTLLQAKSTIEALTEKAWLKQKTVQGFQLSGIGIALHVVEHYSYHTGQIAWWVKQLKNIDLEFYKDTDLNQLNA